MKRKSRKKNPQVNHLNYEEYMGAVNVIKEKLRPGDREEFVRKEGITIMTLNNALQGYYMRGGIKVMYKPLWIIQAMAAFLEKKAAQEKTAIEAVVETVENIDRP